jgi:peptide/nickel transport system substrate-binding protein
MKRLMTLALLFVTVFAFAAGNSSRASAQATGPTGTWLGTWPYVLPPDHTLNAFASNGLPDNLGTMFQSYVELPFAFYNWADGSYTGLLAEKWGFAADNKSYSVTIKAGAKWSDGKPITSDDVVNTFAIGRVLGWSDWNYLSDVKKVDDSTVSFIFSGDASPLAERLILKDYIVDSQTYGAFAKQALDLVTAGKKSDSAEWKKLNADINGFKPDTLIASGPYSYTLKDVGQASMSMHWQPNSLYSGSVKFGEIKMWQGDTPESTPLILSGELAHSTDVYPPTVIDQIKAKGIRLVTIPRGYGPALLFNIASAPWNVKEVRQAVAYVIKRDQNAFLTAAGAVATKYMSGVLDDNVPQLLSAASIAKLNTYDYNADTATKLMTTAGFTKNAAGKWADKDGKTISAEFKLPAEFADFSASAQDAIAQLNKFGFDITARAIPFAEVVKAIKTSDFSLSIWSWGAQSPFASRHFANPTQRWNVGHLAPDQKGINLPVKFTWNGEDVDLDALINAASSSMDDAVRKDRAGKVALILNDIMPFIPLNIEQSVEPFNEALIAGAPKDGDPILKNPSGADHWAILWLLQGKLSPAK